MLINAKGSNLYWQPSFYCLASELAQLYCIFYTNSIEVPFLLVNSLEAELRYIIKGLFDNEVQEHFQGQIFLESPVRGATLAKHIRFLSIAYNELSRTINNFYRPS